MYESQGGGPLKEMVLSPPVTSLSHHMAGGSEDPIRPMVNKEEAGERRGCRWVFW